MTEFKEQQDKAIKRVEEATHELETGAKYLAGAAGAMLFAPIAVEMAPMVITTAGGKVIATKMLISASTQMAVTGDIDAADVFFDGVLINGAGEVVGSFIDLNIVSRDFKLIGINKEENEVGIDLLTGLIAKSIEVKNESLIDPNSIDPKAKKIFDAVYDAVISVTEKAVNEKIKNNNSSDTNSDNTEDESKR